MGQDRGLPRVPFDPEDFNRDLVGLLTRHGLLAITANISVPLDHPHCHIMHAEAGVTQLEIDVLEQAVRRRPPVTGGP